MRKYEDPATRAGSRARGSCRAHLLVTRNFRVLFSRQGRAYDITGEQLLGGCANVGPGAVKDGKF